MDENLSDLSTDQKIDNLYELVKRLVDTLDRFRPLLERYERATQANSLFKARKVMKGEG